MSSFRHTRLPPPAIHQNPPTWPPKCFGQGVQNDPVVLAMGAKPARTSHLPRSGHPDPARGSGNPAARCEADRLAVCDHQALAAPGAASSYFSDFLIFTLIV